MITCASLDTDYKKLCACYSLLEQMRLEHNRQGAIARSDWKTYQGKWAEYAKIFAMKAAPLHAEYVRLKESIRKAAYTDKIWERLSHEDRLAAMLVMYGDRQTLQTAPTLATSDLVSQLKAIDLAKLEGKFTDPLEDWTTYTESDVSGVLTVAANELTITNMMRASATWLYKDFGAGHFGTVLSAPHLVSGKATVVAAADAQILFHTLSDVTTPNNATDPIITLYFSTSATWVYAYLMIDDGATDQFDICNADVIPSDTQRWFTFSRDAAGTIVKIYSESARTNLLDTIAVAQGTTSFRYLHSCAPRGGSSTSTLSGSVYDLDLQEAAGENYAYSVNWKTGAKAISARSSVINRTISWKVGVKASSPIKAYIQTAIFLIGAKVQGYRIVAIDRLISFAIGAKITSYRLSAITRIQLWNIGAKIISLTLSAIIRSQNWKIGAHTIASKLSVFGRLINRKIGINPIESRTITITQFIKWAIGIKSIEAKSLSIIRSTKFAVGINIIGIVRGKAAALLHLALRLLGFTLPIKTRALSLRARSLSLTLIDRDFSLTLNARSLSLSLGDK